MTVIAAWIGDGETAIATDSMSNAGGARYVSPPKVWRHEAADDEVVLAFCGTVDIATRVCLNLNIASTPDADDDRDCWQWADSIASAVWELVTGREGREDLRSDMSVDRTNYGGLLAWRHRLYTLTEYGNAEPEQRHYLALGSGEDVAFGAMHALLDEDLHPDDIVTRAVEAACAHSVTCGLPVLVETVKHV